ncbi:MAG: hypothetical protein AABY83_09615 [Pseudomonadota bacterium]
MELVADANVLIDYAKTDPSILAIHVRHLGPIYVPSVILDEVHHLDAADCERLGLTVIEEPPEILLAAAERRGPLSFEDRVCLLLARENHWTCVTNEKPLHRACEQDGVTSIWGLRLMINLVQAQQLTRQNAMDVAQAIHEVNPRYVTAAILGLFEAELDKM